MPERIYIEQFNIFLDNGADSVYVIWANHLYQFVDFLPHNTLHLTQIFFYYYSLYIIYIRLKKIPCSEHKMSFFTIKKSAKNEIKYITLRTWQLMCVNTVQSCDNYETNSFSHRGGDLYRQRKLVYPTSSLIVMSTTQPHERTEKSRKGEKIRIYLL